MEKRFFVLVFLVVVLIGSMASIGFVLGESSPTPSPSASASPSGSALSCPEFDSYFNNWKSLSFYDLTYKINEYPQLCQ